jgi:predicted nucleotidyltransferase
MHALPAEVSPLLDLLVPAIKATLGEQIVSILLWGSAVLGDYRPGRSDVDLIVGLDRDPDATTVAALKPVHERIEAALPEWRNRIEVAYVGIASLQQFRTREHAIVRLSPGEPLNLRTADGAWRIDWFQARRNGVALFGAAPGAIMPDIGVDELRQEAARQVRALGAELPIDASTGCLAYVALRACRALHVIECGRQASKAGAARWLAARYPQWAELADRALRVDDTIAAAPDAIDREEIERLLGWCAAASPG